MKNLKSLTAYVIAAILVSSCGKLSPQVMTAEKLKLGTPNIVEGTISFSLAAPSYPGTDLQTYPIANEGYRTAIITRFTISGVDAAQFAINGSSVCIVGTEIKAASYCMIDIDYTPASRPSTASAILTIEYTGAGADYSSEFPLEGTAF